MFAIKLDQTNADFLKSPLFNITWEAREYTTFTNGTKNKTTYPMQFEPCTLQHWNELPTYGNVNWTQQFNDGGLADFLCPRMTDAIKFGGSYSVYAFDFIKVQIKPCTNSTDPTRLWQPMCKSATDVTNYFKKTQSVTIMFRMNNYVINPNDPQTPIKSYIEDSIFFPVQPGTAYQTADIYLSENNVKTDQSILPFQNIETKQLLLYNGGNYRLQYVIGNTNTVVADFFLRKDPITQTYNRQFTKISVIAAAIGGFCQTFIIICAILVHYYNGYLCTLELANRLYDFELENNLHPKPHQSPGLPHQVEESFKSNYLIQRDKEFQEKSIEQIQSKQIDKEFQKKKTLKTTHLSQSYNQSNQIEAPFSSSRKQLTEQGIETENQYSQGCNINSNIALTRPDSGRQQIVSDNQINLQFNSMNSNSNLNKLNDENNNYLVFSNKNVKNEGPILPGQIGKVYGEDEDEIILPETPNNKKKVKTIGFKEQLQTDKADEKNTEEKKASLHIDKVNESIGIGDKILSHSNLKLGKSTFIDEKGTDEIKYNSLEKSRAKTQFENRQILRSAPNIFLQQKTHGEIQTKMQNEKEFIQKEFYNYIKKDKSLKLTYKYFIYKMSCGRLCKSSQMVLLDRAKEMMDKEMDISVILNNIKEMQKIKDLLLDKDQQILFNFFPKPQISVKDTFKTLSRQDIESRKGDITRQVDQTKKKEKIEVEQHQRRLHLDIKIAAVVRKASNLFKKSIQKKKPIQGFSLEALERLHNVYLMKSKETSEINQKLIQMLGPELNQLFEASNLITEQNKRLLKNAQEKKLDLDKSKMVTGGQKVAISDSSYKVDIEGKENQDHPLTKSKFETIPNHLTTQGQDSSLRKEKL